MNIVTHFRGRKMDRFHFEIKMSDELSLVLPQTSAATEIFRLIDKDREHLHEWLPWVDTTKTDSDTLKNLKARINGFEKKESTCFFGTLLGEFVASVGFISLIDGVGEIGYWLLSNHNGRGLMTSYVRACVEYGFEALDLKRVVIKCAEGNLKSAAIPQRLGFKLHEKVPRTDGRHTTLVFTLEKEDWEKIK